MPISLRPWADHPLQAKGVVGMYGKDALGIFGQTMSVPTLEALGLLQTSYNPYLLPTPVLVHRNGLVGSIIKAHSGYHHLSIRPDDVWITILSQFSTHVNKSGRTFGSQFSSNETSKLAMDYDSTPRFGMEFGVFASMMAQALKFYVADKELRDWIVPDFSTTLPTDRAVAASMTMGVFEKHVDHTSTLGSAIPSVTLLGSKDDWMQISLKLEMLTKFGAEATLFAQRLQPIIKRFAQSFDTPEHPEVIEFWKHACTDAGGEQGMYLSGWVTAFCFWDSDAAMVSEELSELVLDGVRYTKLNVSLVPSTKVKLPFLLRDGEKMIDVEMVTGSLGVECPERREPERSERGPNQVGTCHTKWNVGYETAPNSMQASIGWYI